MDITELTGPARTAFEKVELQKDKWLRTHRALSVAQFDVEAANSAIDDVTYDALGAGVSLDRLAGLLREDERETADRVRRVHVRRTIGYRASRFGGGAVHVVTDIARFPGYVALSCTGRGMRDLFATDEPVTCKACIRKHERRYLELTSAGQDIDARATLLALGDYQQAQPA